MERVASRLLLPGRANCRAKWWWQAPSHSRVRDAWAQEVASKWEEHARALEGWQAEGAPTTSGTGSGTDLSEWRRDQAGKRFRGYPLHFPIVYNELGQNVCRFFNYGACLKGDACPHDHSSCHVCLGKGHRAQECTLPSHFGGGKVSGIVDTKTLASIQ